MNSEEKEAKADRDWWNSYAPEGWKVAGWTYRTVADFAEVRNGKLLRTLTVTRTHLDFFGVYREDSE